MILLEFQFEKNTVVCMQQLLCDVQNQEETQEVRIYEEMPDIGRVLGAWGQTFLRSKEWRSNEIVVNGGIMAWVLYIPDASGNVQCLETWIPFQTHFGITDVGKDGSAEVTCLLRSIDARMTSSRKILVRANIGVNCTAMTQQENTLYSISEVPNDIQVLSKTYPMKLPKECGEKIFAVDELLAVPAANQTGKKLMYYTLHAELADQKVIAGKAVFRGTVLLHLLCCSEDGSLQCLDFEIPFSQYAELENEYGQSASLMFTFEPTNVELDFDNDGKLHFKAGMTAQYTVFEEEMIAVIEDAYSPYCKVSIQSDQLHMPAILESVEQSVQSEVTPNLDCTRVLDCVFYPDHPQYRRDVDVVNAELRGLLYMLYYDSNGEIQCTTVKTECVYSVPADQNCAMRFWIKPSGKAQATVSGGIVNGCGSVILGMRSESKQGIAFVAGLDIDESSVEFTQRPSLVLRRCDGNSLWELAKGTGSTVEAIKMANHIENEPDGKQVLLIPVMNHLKD